MAGPDIKNIDASADPILGKETGAREQDTGNLDALLDSLNGSAERFQTLWFSFLGLTLYLAITALATTYTNLLLGEPQTLPILNIKVELLPFYVIAPLLYLVFRFYLLMMLVLLARTAAELESELRHTIPDSAEEEHYRARVENALFLQLLVGMRNERVGFNGWMLAIIGLITVVLAPVLTLVLMQMMFLPYHSFGITWLHRGMVAVDATLIIVGWTLFFKYSGALSPLLPFSARPRLRLIARGLAGLTLVALAAWLSGWEGRWAGEPGIGRANLAASANGIVFGLFPDRLKLRDQTIVGKEKLEKTKEEIVSRNGDFVPTVNLDERDLQAADLSGADLRGVSLNGAAILRASLVATRLEGARISCEQHSVSANCAQLQGADLGGAQLQGSNLSETLLQGADLGGAQLQGAELGGAQLQGANLSDAQLQGADLTFAQLQGADFLATELQGADLTFAQLQGADLSGADLSDSVFAGTLVFRAKVVNAHLAVTAIRSVHSDQVKLGDEGKPEPLTPLVVESWIGAATHFALEKDKARVAARFARLKPDFQTREQDARDEQTWKDLVDSVKAEDPAGAQHRHRLATILGDLACGGEGAPYVARGLIRPDFVGKIRLAVLGDQLDAVRSRMEAGRNSFEKCPGVTGFAEEDWRWLEAIKPR